MLLRKKTFIGESVTEEIFNAVSHGLGIFLGIAALVLMVTISAIEGSTLKIVTSSIYGAAIILMFATSTLYHSFRNARLKNFFQTLDHISIYLLIAATYTPVMLVKIGGGWGWSMFGVVWGLALFGTVFKIFFTRRFAIFSLSLYAVMGWLILIALGPVIKALSLPALVWLTAGGLAYTFGIIFYVLDHKYTFAHFFWHILVLIGCACHFFAILFYVLY